MAREPQTQTASAFGEAAGVAGSLPHHGLGHATVFQAGERVAARYQVLGLLGRGGMGEVYAARDLLLDQVVALKTVRSGDADSARAAELLRRELLSARRVTHRHVCHIHDLGVHAPGGEGDEVTFFTMELLAGETLAARLERCGPLSTADAGPLVAQLCEGLAAAHAQGVVHRDFKSQNIILVVDADGRERAVITDFGLALAEPPAAHDGTPALAATATSATMAVAGTAAYMAPEQVLGEQVGSAADIYAFGVVLFEMLTGRLPFTGASSAEVARRRLEAPAPHVRDLRPDVDPIWDVAVACCLERAPGARFASCAALARALDVAPAGRRPRAKVAATLAALAVLGVSLAALWPATPRPGPVARLAPGTAVPMVLHAGGDGDEIVQALARGRDGMLFFGGHAMGVLQLGSFRVAGDLTRRHGFIGALRPDGSLSWVSTLSAPGKGSRLVDLATLPDGDVIAVGDFVDRLLVDGVAVLERPGQECFVVRLAANTGRAIWARACNTSGYSLARAALVDGAGNVYAAVDYLGDLGEGDEPVAEQPGDIHLQSSPMVLSFASDGTPRWRSAGVSSAPGGVRSLQRVGDTLIAGGGFSGELTWGELSLSAQRGSSPSDALLVGIDASTGVVRWGEALGSPGGDGIGAMRATATGELIVLGTLGKGGVLMPGPWIFGFDPVQRRTLWQVTVPATGFVAPAALALLPDGDLVMGGRFNGRLRIGDLDTEIDPSTTRAFLVRLGPHGETRGGYATAGTGWQMIRDVVADEQGRVTVAGKFSRQIGFADLVLESHGQNDGFVVTLGHIP